MHTIEMIYVDTRILFIQKKTIRIDPRRLVECCAGRFQITLVKTPQTEDTISIVAPINDGWNNVIISRYQVDV